jgi:prolyl 4-hydroxylase
MFFKRRRNDPEADPARLSDVGTAVRSRLLDDPRVIPLGGHRADLFKVPVFATAQECRALISLIEQDATPSRLYNDSGHGAGVRTSSTHYFGEQAMAAKLGNRIDALLGLPRESAEPMQGQRYRQGEEYRHHADYFRTERDHWQREKLRGGQRTWTAMLYLNTVEAGGATDFPRLGLAVDPESGMLLVWNNMDRAGSPNTLTFHAGSPVRAGTKYVITQWYRLNPWTTLTA